MSEVFSSAERGTEIPPYLFNATDASSHISDFLSNPRYGHGFHGFGTSGGSVSNWTNFCSDHYGTAVLGYGPLLGCLLLPNVTRGIQDGTLPANLTDIGFSSSLIRLHHNILQLYTLTHLHLHQHLTNKCTIYSNYIRLYIYTYTN